MGAPLSSETALDDAAVASEVVTEAPLSPVSQGGHEAELGRLAAARAAALAAASMLLAVPSLVDPSGLTATGPLLSAASY